MAAPHMTQLKSIPTGYENAVGGVLFEQAACFVLKQAVTVTGEEGGIGHWSGRLVYDVRGQQSAEPRSSVQGTAASGRITAGRGPWGSRPWTEQRTGAAA